MGRLIVERTHDGRWAFKYERQEVGKLSPEKIYVVSGRVTEG